MSTTVGRRVQAGEDDAYIIGRLRPPTPLPAVLWFHYSAGTGLTTINGGPFTLLNAIAQAGYIVLGADMGASPRKNWGNTEATDRAAAMRTLVQANQPVASGGVHVVASSMGTITALRYAYLNPTHVRSVVAVLSVPGMQFVRDNDGTLNTDISTAWGVATNAALPANADPWDLTASLTGLPFQQWCSSIDPIAPASRANTFAAAIGASASLDLGAINHNDAAVGVPNADTVLTFLRAH